MTTGTTRLVITDGTAENTASIIVTTTGSHLDDWMPKSPQPLSPIWASSPYVDGKSLVSKVYDNNIDTFNIHITGHDQDNSIKNMRKFIRLLELAVTYWTEEYNVHKFWLEARSPCETNIRYAHVIDYNLPDMPNPYIPPFINIDDSVIEDLQLTIEHTIWTDSLGVGDNCVKMTAGSENGTIETLSVMPTDGTDDAHITSAGAIATGLTSVYFGNIGGTTYDSGIRFRGITIPAGAVIRSAKITFTASATLAGVTLNAEIYGEASLAPATFSTYADFVARAKTTAMVAWNNVAAWVLGTTYTSPDITAIIQEIIDQAGWAGGAGSDLVVFIDNENTTSANAYRYIASVEHAIYTQAVLVIEYENYPKTLLWGNHTPTCNRENILVPYWKSQNLSYIFKYDDSLGTYTDIIDLVGSQDLLPAAPAANDATYYGIADSAIANAEPFYTLMVALAVAQADITTRVWEYWNGGAWATFTPIFIKGDPYNAATALGVNHGRWGALSAWARTNVNGISGYWIRMRVTAVGGAPTSPEATMPIYTITWQNTEITSTEVGGDIHAILNLLLANTGGKVSNLLISARTAERCNSEKFVATIPLNSNIIIPDAFVVATGGVMTATPLTPTGYMVNYTVAGPAVEASVARVFVGVKTYAGRYRVFARIHNAAATAVGELQMRLEVTSQLSSAYTPYVLNRTTNSDEMVDFGLIALPSYGLYEAGSEVQDFSITILATAIGALNTDFYDLTLMPVDDAHIELSGNGGGSTLWTQPFKMVTSNMKTGPYSYRLSVSGIAQEYVVNWDGILAKQLITSILGFFGIKPNTEYSLFLFIYSTTYQAGINEIYSYLDALNVDKKERFLLARGEE